MYPFPTPDENADWSELADDYMKSSSGTDCTGLIPSAATKEELENYNELYDFLPTAISDGKDPDNRADF